MEQPHKPSGSSRIEKLQRKLYSPNAQFDVADRKKIHRKDLGLQHDWNDTTQDGEGNYIHTLPQKKVSVFAKVLIVAFIFFIGSLGYAWFIFNNDGGTPSPADVELQILGPVSVGSSEPLGIDVVIENNNSVLLETVDLVVEYPDGAKDPEDLSKALPRIRKRLDDIQPGQVIKDTETVALFGEEGTKQEIVFGIEYRLQGSSAIFEKKGTFDVVIQSSPIRIVVSTDKESTAGQDLEFEVEVTSNSDKTISDVLVIAEYPFGFRAKQASPLPVAGSNVWRFETLKPGETKTITLVGSVEAQNGEERVFKFNAGIADDENVNELAVLFTTLVESVEITRPFFDVDITLDQQPGDTFVRTGEQRISGQINYINTLPDTIHDARIEVAFVGDVLDRSSVSPTDGFFKSADNTIVWNQSTYSDFVDIQPGQRGVLLFSFASQDLGEGTLLFKEPEISLAIRVSGNRINDEDVEEQIQHEVFKKIIFNTDVDLIGTTYYSVGAFENTGPIPPRAEQETTYTVQFDILNTSSDLKNARLTASVPEYVKWNNKVMPEGEDISFDPIKRQITWNVGDIRAGAGYVSNRRQLALQLTLFPSITQIEETPPLLTDTQIVGIDGFTGEEITVKSGQITIQANDFSPHDIDNWKVSR